MWAAEEIDRLLGAEADVVRARFGIEPDGNAPDDPHGEFAGRNILYTAAAVDDIARARGTSAAALAQSLSHARQRLFEARSERPRPHLDDKILTAWNGLMIAAFARAAPSGARHDAGCRGEPGRGRIVPCAARGARLPSFERACGTSRRGGCSGGTATARRRSTAYAEDYAGLVFGLLELFEADGDAAWLEWALRLQERQDELFWDEAEGGWFGTTGATRRSRCASRRTTTAPSPAASSVAVHNLLRLAHLTGDRAMRLAHRADLHAVCAANRVDGARGSHDAGRAVRLACRHPADRRVRRTS